MSTSDSALHEVQPVRTTVICSVESDDSTVITIAEDAVISFFVVDELDRSTQRSRSVLSLARVHLYILSAAVLNRVQNDPILLPSVDSTKQITPFVSQRRVRVPRPCLYSLSIAGSTAVVHSARRSRHGQSRRETR